MRWKSCTTGLWFGDWLDQYKTVHFFPLMKSCCMIIFHPICLVEFVSKLADNVPEFLSFISVLPILSVDEWLASCGMACIFLLSESFSYGGLWKLHPSTVESFCDVNDCCLEVFPHSSSSVSVINCWFCPWSTCSIYVIQCTSSFFFSRTFYVCPMAMVDFPSLLNSKCLAFLP